MKYCNERYFFLFNEGHNAIELLNDLEDSFDYSKVLNEFRNTFYKLFSDFSGRIFEIVRSYINQLNLNAHIRNRSINVGHIKNICNGIFSNDDVKNILFHISSILRGMTLKISLISICV